MNQETSQAGRRLDAYVRVSQVGGREGDSFISPQVQEDRIRAWAVAQGHEIVAAHHELDVSGGTMNRPLLNEVMARIDAGDTDGVVVYRLDRFGRTLVGALELIERIRQQEALFASVSDGFDITTETGRLVLNILLSIAQFERERITENWRTARTSAVSRGIHVASTSPYGYRRGEGPVNTKTGKPQPAPLELDPDTAPVVVEIFRRRAGGETWASLRRWLAGSNIPTGLGAPWRDQTIRRIVHNRVYLGIASGAAKGELLDGVRGAHPVLVDEATWHAAQARRGSRDVLKDDRALLRGLVRCATCRYTTAVVRGGNVPGVFTSYVCRAPGCPQRASIVAFSSGGMGLDDFVVSRMWDHLERIEFEGVDERIDVEADEQERADLIGKRERDAQDDELRDAIGRQAWLKQLADLTARISEIDDRVEEKLRLLGRPDGRPVAELRRTWESGEMSMAEQRTQLALVIQMVFVQSGSLGKSLALRDKNLAKRVRVIWASDRVLEDVPRQGRRGYRIKPFVFPSDTDPDEFGMVALQP